MIQYGLRFIEKKWKESFFSDRIERMTTARLNYCFSSRSLHVLRMWNPLMDGRSNFDSVSHQPLTLCVKVAKCLTFNILSIHLGSWHKILNVVNVKIHKRYYYCVNNFLKRIVALSIIISLNVVVIRFPQGLDNKTIEELHFNLNSLKVIKFYSTLKYMFSCNVFIW